MASGDTTKERSFIIGIALAVLLGTVLRIAMSIEPSLRLEEALQWILATNLSHALANTQPPLFPALLAGWIAVFTDNVIVMRLLSVTVACFGIVFAALFARQIAGSVFGVIVAFLFATSPVLIFNGATITPYALMMPLAMMAFYYLLLILDSPKPDPLNAAILTGVLLVGVFTHFSFSAILLWMGLYLLVFRKSSLTDPASRRQIILAFAIPAGAFALYLPVAWSQIMLYLRQQTAFPTALRFPGPRMFGWIEQMTHAATFGSPGWLTPVFALLVFGLVGAGAFLAVRRSKNVDPVVHVLFVVACLTLIIASAIVPVWSEQTIGLLVPGILLLVGLALMGMGKFRWVGLALFVLLGSVGVLWNTYKISVDDYAWKRAPQWTDLVGTLGVELTNDDAILIEPAWYSSLILFHSKNNEAMVKNFAGDLPLYLVDPGAQDANTNLAIPDYVRRVFYICAPGAGCHGTLSQLGTMGYKQSGRRNFMGARLFDLIAPAPDLP